MKKIKMYLSLIFISIFLISCNFTDDIRESISNETNVTEMKLNQRILNEGDIEDFKEKEKRRVFTEESKLKETEKTSKSLSEEVLDLINKERKRHGLNILESNTTLMEAAYERAKEISREGHFSSIRPNGKDWISINDDFNIKYTSAAENIASGYKNPGDLFLRLINQEDTRNAFLSSEYNKLGVGVYKEGTTIYWQLLFINDEAFKSIPKDEFAREVLRLTNEERKKAGLSELETYTALKHAADKRSLELEESYNPDHKRPDGQGFYTVLGEYHVDYNLAGENIAMGQSNPEEVVAAWMKSKGHRENILNNKFNMMGVGVYQYDGVIYWTQLFTD